ncbi:MAG: FkbM family methyltransferase [Verrucomicrobiia bacterium]
MARGRHIGTADTQQQARDKNHRSHNSAHNENVTPPLSLVNRSPNADPPAEDTGPYCTSPRRLDDVLDEVAPDCHRKRIFLKMDTQGYDLKVFKGLGNKLDHIVAIQSEVSLIPIYENMPHRTDSISLYERAGFGVAGLFPVTLDACRVIEHDCLMV